MKKDRLMHGGVLLGILGLGIYMFYLMRGNTTAQMVVGLCTTIGYVLWGIIHHMMIGNLHRKIVIEYILIGAIALVLMLTLSL
ncbi:MAG: hypothetical protein AAB492_00925 [Patescibacteria group bacterium]